MAASGAPSGRFGHNKRASGAISSRAPSANKGATSRAQVSLTSNIAQPRWINQIDRGGWSAKANGPAASTQLRHAADNRRDSTGAGGGRATRPPTSSASQIATGHGGAARLTAA